MKANFYRYAVPAVLMLVALVGIAPSGIVWGS
jgi:hypothetical protein